jgi:hypothetical protein
MRELGECVGIGGCNHKAEVSLCQLNVKHRVAHTFVPVPCTKACHVQVHVIE